MSEAGCRPLKCSAVVVWIPPADGDRAALAGWTGLAGSDRGVSRLVLAGERLSAVAEQVGSHAARGPAWTPLLCRAYWQLRAYLAGRKDELSVPVDLRTASAFQAEVLGQAGLIPFGQTRSYGQLAAAIGRPGAARAVGRALATNPVPLLVPCHRVIGADGNLTGFAGGLVLKRALLGFEGAVAGKGEVGDEVGRRG